MQLLAIDTSSSVTVLGLQQGDTIIDRDSINNTRPKEARSSRYHSRDILPIIQQMLLEAQLSLDDLDAIVFGQGPGSFTGLRIAAGVVQGLAYGLQLPVVPVSSMACLAQVAAREDFQCRVAVALQARLQEVYFGTYEFREGVACHLGPELVAEATQVPRQEEATWIGVGDGWDAHRDSLEQSLGIVLEEVSSLSVPTAKNLLTLGSQKFSRGETLSALEVTPRYLREPVHQKLKDKLKAKPKTGTPALAQRAKT